MLEFSRFAPIRPRKLRGLFAAVKVNKGFTASCHNYVDNFRFYRNLESDGDQQLNRASARDPPRRTD